MNDTDKKLILFDFYGTLIDTNSVFVLKDAVCSLKEKYILVIVSSSLTSVIREYLAKEGTEACFSDIFGADMNLNKIAKIRKVLEKYEVKPEDAVFISDTAEDLKDAEACAVRGVGVIWGLNDKASLLTASPALVVEDPKMLKNSLDSVF